MTEKTHYYTDEKNAQIVIALLKAHGIRKVIANPGTTNISFVGSVQNDPWFQVYSGIDERHSAYMAVGMAAESGEAVVLSCTGATASRNYMPALTEAFYRKLPILALTSSHHMNSAGNLLPQMLDRTVQPRDVVRYSLQCPVPVTQKQISDCELNVNKAILELFRKGGGPVHINLETERAFSFNTKELPNVRVIHRYGYDSRDWPKLPSGKKVAVWIGNHKRFSPSLHDALERFVRTNNAVVFVDKTSSYTGCGAVSASILSTQTGIWANAKYKALRPDVVIHIGEVTGDYESFGVFGAAEQIWRVNEDGEARDLLGKLSNVFEVKEEDFFKHYAEGERDSLEYASTLSSLVADLRAKIPDMPFSNIWIASQLSSKLPQGSCLHLGILNSLRSWNMFDLPDGVESYSNTGGFGIDGCLSTMIGASLASPDKLFFGVVGDLAFFYDLNSLGNRHIGNNLRILLINNNCGSEFNLYTHPAHQFGSQTNEFIAAGGHFKKQSRDLVRHYAEDLGFRYLSAENKNDFKSALTEFLRGDMGKPIVFECFTSATDESEALRAMKSIAPYQASIGTVDSIKGIVPQRVKNVIKAALGQ